MQQCEIRTGLSAAGGGGIIKRPGKRFDSGDRKPPEKFEIRILVTESDIDQLGHVNNVVYIRWVQDAAVAHWRAAAAPADQEALLWVVVRHEIDYKRPAMKGDEVIARTWVGTASGRTFERLTELVRASDNRLLAQARTLWFPIDSKTRKPADVSAEVRSRFSTDER